MKYEWIYSKENVFYQRESSMNENQLTEFDDIRLKLYVHLNYVISDLGVKRSSANFDNVYFLLESLPLATADFDLAKRRIENAERYARSGEVGGARYELRMVLKWIKSFFDKDFDHKTAQRKKQLESPPLPNLKTKSEFEESRSG